MPSLHLLYQREYPVNDRIAIRIPTVGEVLRQEDAYYGMVSMLTATPYDMMVQLDDIGIDYTTINDYDLFLLVFNTIKKEDTSLIFGDLDLRAFEPMVNPQNGTVVLRDKATGVVIDRGVYNKLCQVIRAIHHLKRNQRKPGNQEAKSYLMQRTRMKMNRRKKVVENSQLEDLIVAMVNTEQFPYGFEDVLDLTIYQFNESVRQVIKKIDYDNKMRGIYAGTISAKDLNQDDLNWMTHK